MIPSYRAAFNANFTPDKYQTFLQMLDAGCGSPVPFRNCETPCFFPTALLEQMAEVGKELVGQLMSNADYLKRAAETIPANFRVRDDGKPPLFIQVDFGLTADAQPRLVEIQGFPSLYAFQPYQAEVYRQAYGLGAELQPFLGGLDANSYNDLLRTAILGGHDPENVALLEVDPYGQKTLCDFLLTQKLCGLAIVDVTEVRQQGRELFYERGGRQIPIRRIYNRVISDELERRNIQPGFDFTADLNVEWAGHPDWYFKISKFSLPFLDHECVPKTWFLNELETLPADLENYVLKPLFSFAGLGVRIGPAREEIEAIADRSQYVLQEKVAFAPHIETPFGPTKAEIRIMYIWQDELRAVCPLIRMGRGSMMGVDQNRNMEWIGASAGFHPTG